MYAVLYRPSQPFLSSSVQAPPDLFFQSMCEDMKCYLNMKQQDNSFKSFIHNKDNWNIDIHVLFIL